jgi:chemotaxis methyl-accepting protein methylase
MTLYPTTERLPCSLPLSGAPRPARGPASTGSPALARALRELVLRPRLCAPRARERTWIWSAGCGTGEEAYALAMLCLEVTPRAADRVRVLGTDVNPFRMEQAARGIYGERSVGSCALWPESGLTEPLGEGSVRIAESARRMVSFTQHNLLSGRQPLSPGLFALVRCGTLQELRAADRAPTLALLAESLEPGGWLVLSGEESAAEAEDLERIERPGCVLLRKRGTPVAGTRAHPLPRRPTLGAPALAPPLGHLSQREGALPKDAEAMAQLETAIALEQRADGAGALRALRRALKLDRRLALAHFFSAGIHERHGRGRKARRHYQLVLSLLEGRSLAEIVPQSNGVSVAFVREHAARRLQHLCLRLGCRDSPRRERWPNAAV